MFKLKRPAILPVAEVERLLSQGALALDVRTDKEVATGILKGALHIPIDQLGHRISELGLEKERPVLIYCAVGGRAETAKLLLEKHDFKQVYNAGGYKEIAHLKKSS